MAASTTVHDDESVNILKNRMPWEVETVKKPDGTIGYRILTPEQAEAKERDMWGTH